jgi:pimeloyl-ACP methyl ester carboxylesterase
MLTSLLDGRVMAERYGDGQPSVVALHGWARDSSDWNQTLRNHDALALNLPGFGSTPPPEDAWGSPEYAELTLKAVAGVVTEPFVLVGHSFGGRVAMHVAAQRPDLVSALVLTGVPLHRQGAPRKPPLAFRAARALHAKGLLSAEVMDKYRDKYGSPDYRATSGVMRRIFVTLVNEDYRQQIETVSAAGIPTYLVWGEHDTEAPTAVAERVHGEIAGSTLRIVPDAGHLLNVSLSKELESAITDATRSPH